MSKQKRDTEPSDAYVNSHSDPIIPGKKEGGPHGTEDIQRANQGMSNIEPNRRHEAQEPSEGGSKRH